jgi:hypothetical protein
MLWDGGECGKIKVIKISRKPSTLQIMIDQKRPENVEYFKCLGSPITNDTRSRYERRHANWIGHILRRNCLTKRIIKGKIERSLGVIGRRGRRRKHQFDDLRERREYWKLKEDTLGRTIWRTRFGRGYGPVVRQTA